MDLVHCIYCSASTGGDLSMEELQSLLDECRRKNAHADITGILLYQKRSFFQVLEGSRSVVEALYEKISEDKRHKRVTKVIVEPIEGRAFADWTMGFAKQTPRQLAKIPGLNDFFSSGKWGTAVCGITVARLTHPSLSPPREWLAARGAELPGGTLTLPALGAPMPKKPATTAVRMPTASDSR
jgi:hypothetical protein